MTAWLLYRWKSAPAAVAASEAVFFSLLIFDIINGRVSFLFVCLFKSFLVIIEPLLPNCSAPSAHFFVPWV